MIVCSCNVISDGDIERVLVEIFSHADAPIPTPGLVYRELSKRMSCCGCAPLAVSVIYARLASLEARGLICRYRCATIRDKLRLIVNKSAGRGRDLPAASSEDLDAGLDRTAQVPRLAAPGAR